MTIEGEMTFLFIGFKATRRLNVGVDPQCFGFSGPSKSPNLKLPSLSPEWKALGRPHSLCTEYFASHINCDHDSVRISM